jgi:hypothetical protein
MGAHEYQKVPKKRGAWWSTQFEEPRRSDAGEVERLHSKSLDVAANEPSGLEVPRPPSDDIAAYNGIDHSFSHSGSMMPMPPVATS